VTAAIVIALLLLLWAGCMLSRVDDRLAEIRDVLAVAVMGERPDVTASDEQGGTVVPIDRPAHPPGRLPSEP
jgi:hypothetical protein